MHVEQRAVQVECNGLDVIHTAFSSEKCEALPRA
jgi:hypothetical protein